MIRNDITKMQVDAVVNPSNPELHMGRGTSWAIYHAAGETELTNACRKIGGCEAGKAVLTKGFALPAKFIIHAVCPTWRDGGEQDKAYFFNPFSVEILQKAFARVMESYYEKPREMLLFFYYPSDEYVSFLLTRDSLMFLDEIDCRDIFPGNDPREKMLIFEVV